MNARRFALLVMTGAAVSLQAGPVKAASDANDVLKGLVQPYVPQKERARFLRSAGKDNELSKDEFAASGKQGDGFARSFDRWADLAEYDRDSNGQVGWFEAHAYRRALRKKIIAAWDADRDGRLDEKEYATANRAMAAGRVPWRKKARKKTGQAKTRNGPEGKNILPPMPDEKALLKKHDTDGDGKLSEAERRGALHIENGLRYKALLDAYDADGDGELSREEKRRIWRDVHGQRRRKEKQWELALFDDDGDGKMSVDEKAVRDEYGQKMKDLGKQMMAKVMDTDGDGKVSRMEKLAMMRNAEAMAAVGRVKKRFRSEMDVNGDGQVDLVEKIDWDRHSRAAFSGYFRKLTAAHDTDDDGRFDADERKLVWAEIEKRFTGYMTRADADEDGSLAPTEAEWMVTTFMEDVGVLTPQEEDERGDATETAR